MKRWLSSRSYSCFLVTKNLVSQYSSRFIDKQNDFFVIVGIRECPPPPFKEARGQISSKPRFFSGFFLKLVKLTADQMSQRSFGLIYTVLSRRVKKQQQKHVQIFNRSQSLCLTRMYNKGFVNVCQRIRGSRPQSHV